MHEWLIAQMDRDLLLGHNERLIAQTHKWLIAYVT